MTTKTDFARAKATYQMARADAPVDGPSQDEGDLLYPAAWAASDALMLTPASDVADLAYKLETFAAEECFNDVNRDDLFAALIADARRLGEEKSQ